MASTSALGNGRTVAVRLTDVPIKVRRRYGWHLIERAKEDGDIIAAVSLTAAVENPTDRIYWLPAAQVTKAREAQGW